MTTCKRNTVFLIGLLRFVLSCLPFGDICCSEMLSVRALNVVTCCLDALCMCAATPRRVRQVIASCLVSTAHMFCTSCLSSYISSSMHLIVTTYWSRQGASKSTDGQKHTTLVHWPHSPKEHRRQEACNATQILFVLPAAAAEALQRLAAGTPTQLPQAPQACVCHGFNSHNRQPDSLQLAARRCDESSHLQHSPGQPPK